MENFTYALSERHEGSFLYGSDLEEMKELCDAYRAGSYPNTVVEQQATDTVVYPLRTYCVWIWNRATGESKPIDIQQSDQTNLASSPQIPKGWTFMHATPEDRNDV
jgi:hypothetical protein